MKIELTECSGFSPKDTVLSDIVESKTLGDLVKRVECMNFFVIYWDSTGYKYVFRISCAGFYNEDEYNRFLNCDNLPKIDLLDDHYDIFITFDKFERDCFVYVDK